MTNLNAPLRTCIVCRGKFEQNILIRLQCINKNLKAFDGNGRSFYLCNVCVDDKKKCEKALFRQCKNKDDYFKQLKLIQSNEN